MSEKNWCRCPDPLPPKTERFSQEWKCSVCGGERRYHEKISVQRGGIVSRCGECRYEAERTGKTVAPTLCRAVTYTTQLAGELRERETYYLCDPCIDAEIKYCSTADIFDGRQDVPVAS